jgi:hypothetical protein
MQKGSDRPSRVSLAAALALATLTVAKPSEEQRILAWLNSVAVHYIRSSSLLAAKPKGLPPESRVAAGRTARGLRRVSTPGARFTAGPFVTGSWMKYH